MTEIDERVDEKLERLAQATAGLHARPEFSQRVMLAVEASSSPGWLESAAQSAKSALVVAVLAAAAALTLAVRSDLKVNEASAVAYGAVEVDW